MDPRAPQQQEGRQEVLGTLLGQERWERWEEWANQKQSVLEGWPC